MTAAGAPEPLTRPVHFFPDYRAANPFQTMLHARLDEVGAHAVPVRAPIGHLRRSVQHGGDPGIFCMHWTTPILQGAGGPFRAKLLLDRFVAHLTDFTDAGGRLIWTVHNVIPHDVRHRWAEVELAQVLADQADLVHVLSEETLGAARDLYHLDPAKVVVLEHSSYLGHYPDTVTRGEARARLGLPSGATVLVVLGAIRPYKGIELLLDVFETLAAADPALRLLIAGKVIDPATADRLRERSEADERVITHFAHVPDDQVQVWLRAADVAVLPYQAVLNSGAFLLAQTFGLPVVAPSVGALRASVGDPYVWPFAPGDPDSLAEAVAAAVAGVRLDPTGLGALASAGARARPPSAMAGGYARALEPWISGRSGTAPTGSARTSR